MIHKDICATKYIGGYILSRHEFYYDSKRISLDVNVSQQQIYDIFELFEARQIVGKWTFKNKDSADAVITLLKLMRC